MQRAIRRNQNYRCIEGNRLPQQRVRCLRPRTNTIKLTNQAGSSFDFVLVHRNQLVALFDSSSGTGTRRLNSICEQAPVVLHPRDAVIKDLKLRLLLEATPGEHHASRSKQNQQASSKAEVKIPV